MKFNKLIILLLSLFTTFALKPNADTNSVRYKEKIYETVADLFSHLSPIEPEDLSDVETGNYTCPICYETGVHPRDQLVKVNCGSNPAHIFGKKCILQWFSSNIFNPTTTCPFCNQNTFEGQVYYHDITRKDRILFKNFIDEIHQLRAQILGTGPSGHDVITGQTTYDGTPYPQALTLAINDFIKEIPSESRMERFLELKDGALVHVQKCIELCYRLIIITNRLLRLPMKMIGNLMENDIARDIIISIIFISIVILPENYAFDTSRVFRVLLIMITNKLLYANRHAARE